MLLWSGRVKALVLGSSGKLQPRFSVMEDASCPGSSVTVAEGTVILRVEGLASLMSCCVNMCG